MTSHPHDPRRDDAPRDDGAGADGGGDGAGGDGAGGDGAGGDGAGGDDAGGANAGGANAGGAKAGGANADGADAGRADAGGDEHGLGKDVEAWLWDPASPLPREPDADADRDDDRDGEPGSGGDLEQLAQQLSTRAFRPSHADADAVLARHAEEEDALRASPEATSHAISSTNTNTSTGSPPDADEERHREASPRSLLRPVPRAFPRWIPLAAAAALVIIVWATRDAEPRYVVEGVAGLSEVGPGQSITAAERRARVKIAELGTVVLAPGARLLVEDADRNRHRFFLERGELHARIIAAPRVFQVGTPAGRAVDLGCEYVLTVDELGRTRLSVLSGQVAFETTHREVFVPAGASCISTPKGGPGPPLWDDATDVFRSALERVLASAEPTSADVGALIDAARDVDTLTLWHMIDVGRLETRKEILDATARLVPPPEGVTLTGVLDGDERMRDRWLVALKTLWVGGPWPLPPNEESPPAR